MPIVIETRTDAARAKVGSRSANRARAYPDGLTLVLPGSGGRHRDLDATCGPSPVAAASSRVGASTMRIPLVVDQQVVGLLVASLRRPRRFTRDLVALIEAAGAQLAARMAEGMPANDVGAAGDLSTAGSPATRAPVAGFTSLAELSAALELAGQAEGLEPTLIRATAVAVPVLGDSCALSLKQADGTTRLVVVSRSNDGDLAESEPRRPGAADAVRSEWIDQVMRTGRSLLVRELTGPSLGGTAGDAAQIARLLAAAADSWMILPLVVEGRAIGAMTFALAAASARTLGLDELTVAEAFVSRVVSQAVNAARLDAASRALRDRDHLLLASAHDISNVVAVMGLRVQSLRTQLAAPNARDADVLSGLVRLQAATRRIATIAADLADMGSGQAGRAPELRRRPVDLGRLVADVVAEHEPVAARHALILRVDRAPPTGQWDADRLRRVMDNLLQNAIRYSPAGGRIEIRVGVEEGPGAGWAVLAVEDHGIGIPADDLAGVFDPFYRGANVRDRVAGSGIGLAAAHQIIDQHGGTLTVTSRAGTGSTFTVRLPLDCSHAGALIASSH
jgi:signal transduction histidine kinase